MNIQTPDTSKIEAEALQISQKSQALQVVSHEQYVEAAEFLKAIKGRQRMVLDLMKPAKDAANRAHKAMTELERRLLQPLKSAEDQCGQRVQAYLREQDRLKRIEQERLRLEAEARAKEEAEAQRKRDEDERLAAASALEAQGFSDEANALISQPVPEPIVAPVIAKPIEQAPRVEGVHTRTTYRAEVENLMLLVQEIAAGRQPINLIQANEQVLNKMATALKSELRIPGVKVIENSSVVARASYA